MDRANEEEVLGQAEDCGAQVDSEEVIGQAEDCGHGASQAEASAAASTTDQAVPEVEVEV